MKLSSTRPDDPPHPALAIDAQGHLLPMPEGAAAWSLKRDTGGRPKTVLGADRQPARFPLDITLDDLDTMLGAGRYRVYAINDVGQVIDYVTTIVVGGAGDGTADALLVPNTERAPASVTRPHDGSDLRFALETIREIARVQAEALRAVSDAQADWVKGLANAKALPRNMAYLPPPAVPPPSANGGHGGRDDDEEDEDDDLDEDDAPDDPMAQLPGWLGAFGSITGNVATALKSVADLRNGPAAAAPSPTSASDESRASGRSPMRHLAEINARLTPREQKHLGIVLRSKGGDETVEGLLEMTPDEAAALVKAETAKLAQRYGRNGRSPSDAPDPAFVMDPDPTPAPPPVPTPEEAAPPPPPRRELMPHVMAVSAHLDATERAQVLALLPRLAPHRMEQLKAALLPLEPADAAAWVREHLPELRAELGM
ncbi:MAG: hypothetical protein KC464_06725 [Myxococcales bacterium]|nr:hypothetical protein [Myxococcales bacterium]